MCISISLVSLFVYSRWRKQLWFSPARVCVCVPACMSRREVKTKPCDWTTRWVIHCGTALTAVLGKLPSRTSQSWNIHQDLSWLNIDVVYGKSAALCENAVAQSVCCEWHRPPLLRPQGSLYPAGKRLTCALLCFSGSSSVLFKYLSPLRCMSGPTFANMSASSVSSKLGSLITQDFSSLQD